MPSVRDYARFSGVHCWSEGVPPSDGAKRRWAKRLPSREEIGCYLHVRATAHLPQGVS